MVCRRGGGTLVASRSLPAIPSRLRTSLEFASDTPPFACPPLPPALERRRLKSLSRETARRPRGRSAAMAPYLPSLRTRRSEPRSGRDHHLCDPSGITRTRMAAAAHAPAKPRLLPATSAFADCLRDPQLQN